MRCRTGIAGLGLLAVLSVGGCASTSPQPSSQDEMVKKILAGIDTDKIARDAVAKVTGDFRPTPHDDAVLWQITATALMSDDITGLRLVSPDRLLLTTEDRNPRLINADNGSTVWEQRTLRYDKREPGAKGKAAAPKYPSSSYVALHRGMILLRADGDGGSKLLAVETVTGDKRWAVELKKSGELNVIPLPASEILLAVRQEKRKAVLTAYNFSTGALVWEKETGYGGGTSEPPAPTVDDDAVFTFHDGVERLSAATGTSQWRRPGILAGRQAPPMQLEDGRLYLIDGKNTLHILDAGSGKTLASARQRDTVAYTTIVPAGDRVYLLGVEKGKSGEAHFFVASVRGGDGKELWVDYDKDPSVSNLIDEDGRLYFSTPFTVVALDRETGKRRFAVRASDVGKSFPVRIAKYGDRIVYIGELVVAAFDGKTGAKVYRHGFNPVNQTTHMDALNEAIESTSKWLSWFTGPWSDVDFKSLGFSTFFFQQAVYYQNQSNAEAQIASKYAREANTTWSGVDYRSARLRSDIHRGNAMIAASSARAQHSMGMAFMTVENIQRGMAQVTAKDRERLKDLLRIRKLLYAAYVVTQQGDYVYRPTKESDTVGISVIHLPTGRMSHTPLTPEHGEFGVFNLVDFEKGIVYHPAVQKTTILNAYFIARPVKIPR